MVLRGLLVLIWVFATSDVSKAQQSQTPRPSQSAQQVESGPAPNILLVLTDDQGWATLGSYGGKHVRTPHLDRLAAEGVRFTDAYVTSQCTPTRATLMTGQYTARNGLWHVLPWYGYPWALMTEPAYSENYSRDTFTIAKGLRDAGYVTAIVGKWHLTNDADGNYMGLRPDAAKYYGFDYAPPVITRKEFAPGGDRGVELLTTQAIEFIQRNRRRPWFCFLSHHMIHGVVVAPDELTQKYRERGYGDQGPHRAVYLAGLECIDRSIGRLLRRLDQLGESEQTLVLFLSDNGGVGERLDFKTSPALHENDSPFKTDLLEYDNSPLRAGKGSTYEGGTRVPMLARWPGRIPPGLVIKTPVHAVDILPTCFQAAGATIPPDHPVDGRSLLSLMAGSTDEKLNRRPIFQYYPFYDLRWGLTPNASIRLGDYKLIEFFGDRVDVKNRYVAGQRIELFNLRNDLGETTNLASEQPELAARLVEQLHQWMKQVGAGRPVANTHFDAARAFLETRQKPPWLKDAVWRSSADSR